MGLVGLTALTLAGAPGLAVHIGGLVLFAGRVAHAIGLSRSGEASPLRAAGVAATWAAYIFLAVALLFYALP
jgi:uncharacterized protein